MNKCNHDSSSYAYIITKDSDKRTNENKIYIDDYLNNNTLQKSVLNNEKFIVCKNGHKLIKYKSNIVKSHFFHDSLFKHDNNANFQNESKWHIFWKNNFELIEYKIPKIKGCKKSRRVDACINNKTLEFQHSEILYDEVVDRCNDHTLNGYQIMWIIDCTDDSISLINLSNGFYLLKFLKNEWKYSSFTYCKYIYLDCGEEIFRIQPKYVKSSMIYVGEYKTKKEFIKELKNDNLMWKSKKIPQCNIYFNQRGAGCGKTYESVQLINNDNFLEKNVYIYLTKMHSVKEVIYKELMEQKENGKLSHILIEKDRDHLINKQYKITFTRNITESKCKIIIGTIDAFMIRLGDTSHNENDYFYGIIKSIKNDYAIDSKDINFGGENLKLCKETIVIIDEAQDLSPDYVQAIAKLMGSTHFDTYIIGDKLQSIWDENNVFTFLENNDFPHPIKIHRFNGKNHVRRFHNQHFMTLVNNIIDFDKYNLPKITNICNSKCNYHHDDNIIPYNIFELPKIYNNKEDNNTKNIQKIINKITDYVEKEVNDNNYLPHNFMFIFPYLKKNYLANNIESKLQDYWVSKFQDEWYNKNIVKKNKYWKKNWKENKYFQYIYFHKSSEGRSINLKESEHSTRILSIHASKGTGCEVVFLLGISEQSLHFYTNVTGSLQYDSLLHVAITRQKMKLYVGIDRIECDICKRFSKYTVIEQDKSIEPKLNTLGNKIHINKISSYNFVHAFNRLNDIFNITENNKINDDYKNDIIDWGHHVIRYAVFVYQFLMCIYNNEKCDDFRDQFITIIRKIMNKKPKLELYNEYQKSLSKINEYQKSLSEINENGETKEIVKIPILYFKTYKHSKYIEYKLIIIDIIKNIQKNLKKSLEKNKLPKLCPLESVILWHVIELLNQGKHADITIMDIYNILYYYDETFNEDHRKYHCKCNDHFQNNIDNNIYHDIRNSIKNHYEKINSVTNLYYKYNSYIINITVILLKNLEKKKYLNIISIMLLHINHIQ